MQKVKSLVFLDFQKNVKNVPRCT